MERVMPIRTWTIPSWLPLLGGKAFSLNPGPFNIKEHGLIFMMANSVSNVPYGSALVLTARKHYGLPLGPRPTALVSSALLNALHAGNAEGGLRITQVQFFVIATFLAMVYYLLPGHLPITGYMAYDRFARPYDIDRVLNPNRTLNITAYAEYSPLYIPISFVMTYMIAFILTTAMVAATILDHGPKIWRAMKQRDVEDDDLHARLMRKYPEVPGMWYAAVLIVFLGLAIAAVKLYVYSCSGQVTPINLLSQIVAGLIWHGQPITVMVSSFPFALAFDTSQQYRGLIIKRPCKVFKTFAVQWHQSSVTFTENLKLGHYLKVPPRCTLLGMSLFGPNSPHLSGLLVHLLAGFLVTAFEVALQQWIFDAVPDLCESDQKAMLTCPNIKVFYTASIF
ncbi:hypothetical protein FS837_012801, partial [Tulasnella sp. UAMH 9824]